MQNRKFIFILSLIFTLVLSACAGNGVDEALSASGTIAGISLDVAPELSGRVIDKFVSEGETVQKGDALFQLDDEILIAQSEQAQSAVNLAQATLDTATEQVSAAEIQLEQARQGARYDELKNAVDPSLNWPPEFNLPSWYFDKPESLAAIQSELERAEETLQDKQITLEQVLGDVNNATFLNTEKDLAEAQTAFLIAQQTMAQVSLKDDSERLKEAAQEQLDAALKDLEAVQLDYDRQLSSTSADEVLDARAQVEVAHTHVKTVQLAKDALLTGEESLMVAAAKANLELAHRNQAQAKAGLEQAQAAARLLEIQLGKTIITAPIDGVITADAVKVGELVSAGMTAMTISQLAEVELTVYVPEDRYGLIYLGQPVSITVDSYPGETFKGEVVHISNEAEFTPRNVQTIESRKTTVYAIKALLPNPDWKLKPGMPADLVFLD
ncbi:MAG: efflux RND transporter periplasmic adaptor subunit [Anaerolineaceae bacterium]|nr:efflux RND transporter periplasmic adaptor subunit [Anaerolineaceae bacterium]